MVNVFLTIDTEIWCGGWKDLDARFPEAFKRYVYGPTKQGDYALPAILEILSEHGLTGVFFVEPLFSFRFGQNPLHEIVGLIREAGMEIQLHLHTEWVNETGSQILQRVEEKKKYLRMFSLQEQVTLIKKGMERLKVTGLKEINAFRAGNYALNTDTLRALNATGIAVDTSYNPASRVGTDDVVAEYLIIQPHSIEGIHEYPVSVFHDGRNLRHMQVGACSYSELENGLRQSEAHGWSSVVIVLHNFELLTQDKLRKDVIVSRRFRRLCKFLEQNQGSFHCRGFNDFVPKGYANEFVPIHSSFSRTLARMASQAARRLI